MLQQITRSPQKSELPFGWRSKIHTSEKERNGKFSVVLFMAENPAQRCPALQGAELSSDRSCMCAQMTGWWCAGKCMCI